MKKRILTWLLAAATACTFNGAKKEEISIDIPKTPAVAVAVPDIESEPNLPIPEPKPEIVNMGSEELVFVLTQSNTKSEFNQLKFFETVAEEQSIASAISAEEETIDISEETILVEEPVVTVSEEDIALLACTIYCEAGSDSVSDLCRYYVADTVLNRVDSPNFPNTIYEVLTAPMAYGRFHWTGVIWPDYSYSIWEQPAIERAYRIARDILVNENHTWIYGNHYVYQSEYQQSEVGFYLDGSYFGAE